MDRLDLACQRHNPGFSAARDSSRVYETRAEICFQNREMPRLSVRRDKLWVRTKLAAAGTDLPHRLCGDIFLGVSPPDYLVWGRGRLFRAAQVTMRLRCLSGLHQGHTDKVKASGPTLHL